MSFESWLFFCITEAVLCLTPGPAVLLVVSLSLTRGASAGLNGSLGILAANAMYFAISATSLGALLLASWQLFTLIRWVGAFYLVWCGIQMIVQSRAAHVQDRQPSNTREKNLVGSFPHGFLTQSANPKALVFFTAILPQFIDPRFSVGRQLVVLGASSIVIELIVLSLYVAACHQTRGLAQHTRINTWFERVGGALLIGAGARLATQSRG